MLDRKYVLIIGDANKYFRKEYVRNLKNDRVIFDILSFEKCKTENKALYGTVYECVSNQNGKLKALTVYLKFCMILIGLKKYDCIHIHSVKPIESTFSYLLKHKCRKLICTIYGSDFYRINNRKRRLLMKLFDSSDIITVATEQVKGDFNSNYQEKYCNKIRIVPFGNSMYDEIDKLSNRELHKEEFGVPKDSFVITIGYNATCEQHHYEILENIKKVEQFLPKNYYLLIPLGYGDSLYRENVCDYLQKLCMNGKCLCDYYSIDQAAKLRKISDIMIQLQDTDVLSASMMEYIYADNIIITGSWLPYKDIKDYIITINCLEEVGDSLKDILKSYRQYKNEHSEKDYKKFIRKHYTWSAVKEKWLCLYD